MSHIAILLPDLEVGGAQRVMLQVAQYLVNRGHHIDLILISNRGLLRNDVPRGVSLYTLVNNHLLGNQLLLATKATLALGRWLSRHKPQTILSTITGANIVAIAAKLLFNIPTKVVIREAVTLANVRSKLRQRIMQILYPKADAVIALTSVMAEELVNVIKVPRPLIHCIPNPIDASRIRSLAAEPLHSQLLQSLCGEYLIVAVGRLIPQKDYQTLIQAMSTVVVRRSAKLVIVGEGPERHNLEKLIDDLQLRQYVGLAGHDNNPWRWMAKADLFVLSSRWEGYPNALLEALTLGCHVISTMYDESVREMLEHYSSAERYLTVKPSDPIQLGEQISLMLDRKSANTLIQKAAARDTPNPLASYEEIATNWEVINNG